MLRRLWPLAALLLAVVLLILAALVAARTGPERADDLLGPEQRQAIFDFRR